MEFSIKNFKITKERIIYLIGILIFLGLLAFYLSIRFAPNNFVEQYYNNVNDVDPSEIETRNQQTFIDEETDTEKLTFVGFLNQYIDSLFIYSISAFLLIFGSNVIIFLFKQKMSKDAQNTIALMIRVIVIPLFVVAYLNKFEAFAGAIVGVGATMGLAFGLAVSRYIGDLITGLSILFNKHFDIGEYVIVPAMDLEGVIEDINVYNTIIEEPGENLVVLPNSELKKQKIINLKIERGEKVNEFSDLVLFDRKVTECVYRYPLVWAVPSTENHYQAVEAIEETTKEFRDFLEEDATWIISERTRLEREYTVFLTVLDSHILLSLVGEFRKTLESNYQDLRDK